MDNTIIMHTYITTLQWASIGLSIYAKCHKQELGYYLVISWSNDIHLHILKDHSNVYSSSP